MAARSTNLFKDSSTRCFHEFLTTLPGAVGCEEQRKDSDADFLGWERFVNFMRYGWAGTT
jgi:hypothetical protein